jgi:PAS domain S-box-containing protein
MDAPKERPQGCGMPGQRTDAAARLRMRFAPEAVIIVTRQNRIVLVQSRSWSMEEFNRRELVEIVVPDAFKSASASDVAVNSGSANLPVELSIGQAPTGYPDAQISTFLSGSAAIPDARLVGLSADAIIATRPDGTIASWNAGARDLYGYAEDEAVGKSVSLLIPYERSSNEERLRSNALAGEPVSAYDTARIKKDGGAVEVSVALSPIHDAAGEIIGTVEIGRDISERQRGEKSLTAQIVALTQSNAELQDYARSVAHDLQSPLNMVAAYFTELTGRCEGKLDAETRELLASASNAVPRMQKLIKDLLELARLDAKPEELTKVDCSTIVTQVLANLELEIRQSGAKIMVSAMPTILSDPTQLGQVFQNLIANAIKFRREGAPKILVGAERRPGEWRFSVSDNGIGIDPSMIHKLFQPLRRLHTTGPYSGTGLGLAIARRILTRQGGRIWVESQPGVGSTFYFTIPSSDSKDSKDLP